MYSPEAIGTSMDVSPRSRLPSVILQSPRAARTLRRPRTGAVYSKTLSSPPSTLTGLSRNTSSATMRSVFPTGSEPRSCFVLEADIDREPWKTSNAYKPDIATLTTGADAAGLRVSAGIAGAGSEAGAVPPARATADVRSGPRGGGLVVPDDPVAAF